MPKRNDGDERTEPAPQVDSLLRSAVADALRATGRYTSEYEVVRQVISGSRMNYVLAARVDGTDASEHVWCRATYPSIDQALSDRFTLTREREVIAALSAQLDRVPVLLGSSADGTVMIQRYVAEDPGGDRAAAIPRYMRALDGLHRVDPRTLPSGWAVPTSARDAVDAEQQAWSTLASDVLERPSQLATAERESGLTDLHGRLLAILEHLQSTPVPPLVGRPDLVHGDAGRANYLVDTAGEVWLLDWELAHAGHRYEDYAWIELRGLEQDNEQWCEEVVSRLLADGSTAVDHYEYFRTMIYFRSVIAIAARIAAEPLHDFVPYLAQRLDDNELFGWLSAGRGTELASDRTATHRAVDATRLDGWQAWSRALAARVIR